MCAMIKSWSFSILMNYEQCPHWALLKLIHKLPEPFKSEAALRGESVHQQYEHYLKKTGQRPECSGFIQNLLDQIPDTPDIIEDNWGFNDQWQPTPWRNAWLRMKLDLAWVTNETTHIVDFKTGKKQGNEIKHTWQGQLYACGAHSILQNPTYKVEFWYLDRDQILPITVHAQQIPRLRESWTRRATKMLEDTTFKPIPNKSNCRFCSMKDHCEFTVDD